MLRVYTSSINGTLSSKHVFQWLNEQKIDYDEIKVNKTPLTATNFYNFLPYAKNGLDSFLIRTVVEDQWLKELPLSEAIDYLVAHPKLVRKPILFDGKHFKVGFQQSDIRCFIPKDRRRKQMAILYKKELEEVSIKESVYVNELLRSSKELINDK